MSKIITVVFLLLVIIAGAYRATHSPVYGNCHTTAEGRVCTLLGYKVNH